MARRKTKQGELLSALQVRTKEYAEKATLLSNLLEQAECFLNEMPGKVFVETSEDSEGYRLCFEKGKNEWRLNLKWITESSDHPGERELMGASVTASNVAIKVIAARLLPELYRLLEFHIVGGLDEIDRGLSALQDLPFLDFDEAHQGNPSLRKERGDDNAIPF